MPPPTTIARARSTVDAGGTRRLSGMSRWRVGYETSVMKIESIAARTGMGPVEIAVTEGDRALRFYRDYVGLAQLPSADDAIRMSAGDLELVVLRPGAEGRVAPHRSGLYHLAIVVPDRRELARVIGRLA